MTEPRRIEPTLQREPDPTEAGRQSSHQKVRGLRTRVAMNRVLLDVAATILAALALAYYLRASESVPWLKSWLLAAGAVSVLRCLTLLAFHWTRGRPPGSGAWWRGALALGALLNGVLWGALAVSPAIAGELPVDSMILGLCFLVAVAVYTFAPTLVAFALFVLAAAGPWLAHYLRLVYPLALPPEREALLARYLAPSTLEREDLLLLLGFVALLGLLYIAMHHAVRSNTRLAFRNAALKVAQDDAVQQRVSKGRAPVYAYQAFSRERQEPRPETEAVSRPSSVMRPSEPAADVALRDAETRHAAQPERKSLESFEAFHHAESKPPAQAFRQERRSAPQDERAPETLPGGALPDALLTQIDELLAYTSMNAGELFVESAPFELRDALRRAFAEPIEQARAKSLQFNCTVAETVPDRLIGDCKKVQHSLANIVRNAVKFTASGTVTVEVSSAPRPDADGAVIRFAVTDTGVGMSPEQQRTVFAGLTKESGIADYSSPSAGFGLAVAAGFIHAMHGTIEARSAPGQGSRFDVTIPFVLNREPPRSRNAPDADTRRASAAASESTQPPAPSGSVSQSHTGKVRMLARSSAHVLLVEDNPDNQMLALHLLKKQGFEVSIANNGLEAVEMAATNAFDLILMDIQMPDMGGLEATAKIRAAEQGSGRRVPIIAVTANAQDEDRQVCLDAGMDDHVTKPLDRTRLFAAIATQLRGGAQAAVSSSR
jgi:CheY-like chemotaxis protein